MSKVKIIYDGRIIDRSYVYVENLAPGLLKAKGVFETLRAYNGQVFALDLHLERLAKGAKQLQIALDSDPLDWADDIRSFIKKFRLKNSRVRILLWRQNKQTHWVCTVQSSRPPTEKVYTKGYQAIVVKTNRQANSVKSYSKSLAYAMFINAYQRALDRGCHEAVLLNENEHVFEGSRSNLFWIKNNTLFTPSLNTGCLAGVTRQKVLDIVKELGLKVVTSKSKLSHLLNAEEAFMTNSFIEIMPLVEIQGQPIGDGVQGRVTRLILSRYKALLAKQLM